ncbi:MULTISPECIES: zinc-binding alcohol dehydrogenase family protein [unclassified Pseudoalteromonas]|uniref:zinc-binding alcohol dehydrogenase family protein n=1 Tax=unclassified Pseudoalteromonas TaxID=194690 RepID=UPI000A4AEFC2|nr:MULTISPECIES: zinc-binding alcohol dehydrogenase family protein [unclassified Pseudoalteromonas]
MMKSIVCQQPGELNLLTTKKPQPKPGEVLLKIRAIGVCGTDIHAYGGNQPFFTYPRVLGHELSGEIEAVGEGVDLPIGKPAYVIPYLECGKCVACRAGKTNCCTDIEVIGVHRDGGMCEYLCLPATHVVITEGVGFDELAVVECLAIGAHAVRRGEVSEKDTVMVLGAGPIGLGAAQFAKVAGAKTFIADVNADRLGFAKRELNLDATVDCTGDVKAQLASLTSGDFPTVIIDCTGNPGAMQSTFGWLAHGGTLVFVSVVKADICFNDPEFHKRETTLKGSRNATKEDFEHVVACLSNGSAKSTCMVTHKTQFDNFPEVFPEWVKPETGVVKAVIEINE